MQIQLSGMTGELLARRSVLRGLAATLLTDAFLRTNACLAASPASLPSSHVNELQRRSALPVLRRLAPNAPCAATALIFLLQDDSGWKDGVLYLDQRPSEERMKFLLGEFERGSTDLSFLASQRNPYSSSSFVVEVRWSLTLQEDEARLLTFRALLAERSGAVFIPPHPVEGAAGVLVLDGELRLPGSRLQGGALV